MEPKAGEDQNEATGREEGAAFPRDRLVRHFFLIKKAKSWEEQLPSPYYYLQILQARTFVPRTVLYGYFT